MLKLRLFLMGETTSGNKVAEDVDGQCCILFLPSFYKANVALKVMH